MWPVVHGSVASAAAGQPGLLIALLLAVAAVWALVKHRSKLFIAFDVGGFFVVLAFALLVTGLLAAEFVHDPMGLDASTARARRVATKGRAALPRGSMTRAHILRRPRVSPSPPPDDGAAAAAGTLRVKTE